jgi:hypothetical protein
MIRTEYADPGTGWQTAHDDEYKVTRPVLDTQAAQDAHRIWVHYWDKTAPTGRKYRLAAYKTKHNGQRVLIDAIAVGAR